uniref:SGNH domain-containing protein n=1 Tax=Oryza glumipatula TaxID=40148 RepID=A0A0D9Y5E0_9ORYZ
MNDSHASPHCRIGFREDVLTVCCGGGGPYNFNESVACGGAAATACEDPSALLYFDGAHLTEAGYRHDALHGLRSKHPDATATTTVVYADLFRPVMEMEDDGGCAEQQQTRERRALGRCSRLPPPALKKMRGPARGGMGGRRTEKVGSNGRRWPCRTTSASLAPAQDAAASLSPLDLGWEKQEGRCAHSVPRS